MTPEELRTLARQTNLRARILSVTEQQVDVVVDAMSLVQRDTRAALLRDLMEPSRAASEVAIEALHAPENKHGAVLDEVLIAYIRTYADENLIDLEAKP